MEEKENPDLSLLKLLEKIEELKVKRLQLAIQLKVKLLVHQYSGGRIIAFPFVMLEN